MEGSMGEWAKDMKKKLDDSCRFSNEQRKYTISRVPQHLRQEDQSAYQPKIISIGPYHSNDKRLKAMEEHKWISLRSFLSRNPAASLENYIDKIRRVEKDARNCYSEKINLDESEFVKMLVLDGCFIIELFLRRFAPAENDLMYNTRWMLPLITHDMLLLENQIPFFVLQLLFNEHKGVEDENCSTELVDFAIHFFVNLLPGDADKKRPDKTVHHLLHLLRFFHSRRLQAEENSTTSSKRSALRRYFSLASEKALERPKSPTESVHVNVDEERHEMESGRKWDRVRKLKGAAVLLAKKPSSPSSITPSVKKSIPGAKELHEAGIKFKAKKDANSYLEVTFHDGILEIPRLLIQDTTNSLFRNIIAFEQCYPVSNCHFTSYAFFMDRIVNTPADVALLKENKIIEHWLGSDKDVAKLFNRLCNGVAIETQNRSYFPKLFKQVRDYCDTDWHTWRASLVHDYFSSPWAIVSVVGAIVLLSLTLIQTFLSALPYL